MPQIIVVPASARQSTWLVYQSVHHFASCQLAYVRAAGTLPNPTLHRLALPSVDFMRFLIGNCHGVGSLQHFGAGDLPCSLARAKYTWLKSRTVKSLVCLDTEDLT